MRSMSPLKFPDGRRFDLACLGRLAVDLYDEQVGRFLVQTLQREGCDTSMVQVDPQRLTALVLLGLKDRDTFPLLFYRENCADMALDAASISEDFVAQCRA